MLVVKNVSNTEKSQEESKMSPEISPLQKWELVTILGTSLSCPHKQTRSIQAILPFAFSLNEMPWTFFHIN